MKLGFGKKGDVTITTVILIVLGLAVLVMMIIGFTKGWDFIFKPISAATPSDLQTFAKVCEGYAQASLGIDFCNYRKISGELVNCRDPRIIASLDAEGVSYASDPLKCWANGVAEKQAKVDACRTLALGKPETKINGELCSKFIGVCNKVNLVSTVVCVGKSEEECGKDTTNCKWEIP